MKLIIQPDAGVVPIVQALRAGRPFAVPPPDVPLAGPCLAPIARADFVALTRYRHDAPPSSDSGSAGNGYEGVSERGSRSHV